MKSNNTIFSRIRPVRKYRFNTILSIAVLWTLIDIIVVLVFNSLPENNTLRALLLREVIVFIASIGVGYLLVTELRRLFRDFKLLTAFVIKSGILIVAAFLINVLIYAIGSITTTGVSVSESFHHFYDDFSDIHNLLQKLLYWLILFVITQLIIELNEKYSPGVFMDILLGKYVHPKIEKRIIMFMDLKDSTPIAEKLGSQQYFRFIREFIYHLSNALIEYGGRIYQYVGDEIVVSWLFNEDNTKKCLKALIQARRNLNKSHEHFRRLYGILPEFRVGIHVGEVTVGEIGVIKKDIAMSGDTMNTTARIRTACSELNQKFVVSKTFAELLDLKEWQQEDLGAIELKGKKDEMQLVALKI